MASHLKKGRQGEELAYRYILDLGWSVLDRNVRFRSGELDLVARDGDIMVVVEVRYRSVAVLMPTEATVGPKKIRRLVRTGAAYMNRIGWDGFWRIDLVALTEQQGRIQLDHYRDITGGDVVL